MKRLIKTFAFEEETRSRLRLGVTARLVPEQHRVELVSTNGVYALSGTVQTWTTNPNSVKQWIGFQVSIKHKKDVDNNQVTDAVYRLVDKNVDGVPVSNAYWWDGSAWVPTALSTDWNDEATVAANIAAFPATSKKIGVVVLLSTTDAKQTPELYDIKLAYRSDVEIHDDLIYRTLVPFLRDNVRPYTEHIIKFATPSSTWDFSTNASKTETPYKIVNVVEGYDEDTDPDRMDNVVLSYNPTTQAVTFTSVRPAGSRVRLRLIYKPEVAVYQHQEFNEVYQIPAIIIDDIADTMNEIGAEDSVADKATGDAIQIQRPFYGNIDIGINVITDKGVDHLRLVDEIARQFAMRPLLRSRGLDEDVRLLLTGIYNSTTSPNPQGLHTSRLRARLVGALVFARDALDAHSVLRFNVTSSSAP